MARLDARFFGHGRRLGVLRLKEQQVADRKLLGLRQPTTPERLFNDVRFSSNHTGGTQFLMGDGRVIFVSANINMPVYLAAASRNGGEALQIE